jgi:predicted alpha/beta-hydrolase family hydrolase
MILTHGAGANCQTLLLTTLADAFCAAGLTVLRCDLPFRHSRPNGPPPRGSAERDQAGLRLVTGGHELISRRDRQEMTKKVVPAFLSFARCTT